ncbi:MAG: hypothetical protein CVV64_02795 [Candidatus Wallbacteria bacterium HGW-Wallbacteria-1]|jgi:tRNA G18 (ribose-2'-O)-methylase SpoU|uniref:tRNA/rRNA methyltransferase SpoU type domain-containing protein n=1 Tax=Candidatus Wallbacteria bacterium HGW-Wallbacteria-1 TaxID=2013854 RepID=A0A2N1PTD4_9BACT|nr:MAG: hypothetical protein CVV64_02795 [Candidatus Wallbacteria bacterium HGW-Wallbacteria-1]
MKNEIITSSSNSIVKTFRAISDNRTAMKKGLHLVEGIHSVQEYLLHAAESLECIIVAADSIERNDVLEIMGLASAASVRIHVAETRLVNSIATAKKLETCIGLGKNRIHDLNDLGKILSADASSLFPVFVLWIHGISNPANLGAIYRLSRAVGARTVILSGNHVFAFSPQAVRASQGASCRVSIVSGGIETEPVFRELHKLKIPVHATVAREGSTPWQLNLKESACLMFGPESQGLSGEDVSKAQGRVTIPMVNETESLSIVQAVTAMGYEMLRQNLKGNCGVSSEK